jgi:hypothetical protein
MKLKAHLWLTHSLKVIPARFQFKNVCCFLEKIISIHILCLVHIPVLKLSTCGGGHLALLIAKKTQYILECHK